MATFAERLASFAVAHPATKKRTSSAKSTKTLQWPHQNPLPARLAEAGFLYCPTSSNPDNTTCFLCHSNLDGWEADDNPFVEHLKLSPNCGWAINVCIEQNIVDVSQEDAGPTSERMSEARRMTFESRWPHEGKRGWVCKSQKMADAGWYYCPSEESEDLARCAYCNLSLDGWEPKDKPYDEHQRRSADCPFFSPAAPKAKSSRGRKARTSKASRLSSQSNITAAVEGISLAVSEANNDDGVMVQNNDTAKPAKADKGSKKGTKAKKSNSKSDGKATKAGGEESMQASSFVEPEDDDFEVKVAQEPTKPKRGTKRKSEDVQEDRETTYMGGANASSIGPAAKKRATRTRASSAQPESKVATTSRDADDNNTHMADAATMPPPPPVSKKAGKTGRKRASSNIRKTSATSTTSMASLRAVPDDDDIDAALEADLDRPLTDDEADIEPPPAALPKTRRLTRTRPTSRNGPASIAPTRRTTRTSTVIDTVGEGVQDEPAQEQEPEQQPTQETAMDSKTKVTKAAQSRKVSRKQTQPPNPDAESNITEPQNMIQDSQEQEKEEPVSTRGARSRQASRQAPLGKPQASETPPLDPSIEYPRLDHDSSALKSLNVVSHGVEDESGHETDVSIASQGLKKRGRKKVTGAGKKPKAGKKAGMMSRNIEDIVQPETTVQVVIVQPGPSEKAAVEEAAEPTENEIEDTAAPKKGSKKKTAKSTKAKSIKSKAVIVLSSPPASQMSEPWTDQPLGESTPVQPARADSPTFTPIEAAQIAPPPQTATPEKKALPEPASVHKTPRLVASPQSSDAENQPPSSRPSEIRPPLDILSPSKSQTIRIPLAASTPTASSSRRNISKLQTSMPWTAVDLEKFLLASPNVDKENVTEALGEELTSPEKKLTVEEWIYDNARKGEEKLRNECERLVGRFEGEGVRALKTLEGIRCAE